MGDSTDKLCVTQSPGVIHTVCAMEDAVLERQTDGKMMQIRWIVIRVSDSVEPESRLATQASVLGIWFAGRRASSLGGTDGEICDEWCAAEREFLGLAGTRPRTLRSILSSCAGPGIV